MNRRLQFSLKTLFIATAALAIVVSLWRKKEEESPLKVPVSDLGKTHVLLGRTHCPLGEVTTLKGLVFDGPSKGYDDGPNVRVQVINGRATQEIIELPLVSCLGGEFDVQGLGDPPRLPWGQMGLEDLSSTLKEDRRPRQAKLTNGHAYEFKGYESGEYVGIPSEAMGEIGLVQTSGFHLHLHYVVAWAKEIHEIRFAPDQFVDREAVLEGIAKDDDGRAYLVSTDWRLLVDAASPWPPTMVGKDVTVLSTIRRTGDERLFRAERPEASLINLADQIGQEVRLRGRPYSGNGDWWLLYRGTSVYLGPGSQLATQKFQPEFDPAVIGGVLRETPIPTGPSFIPNDVTRRGKCFVLDVKSWQAIDALLSPELGPVPRAECRATSGR